MKEQLKAIFTNPLVSINRNKKIYPEVENEDDLYCPFCGKALKKNGKKDKYADQFEDVMCCEPIEKEEYECTNKDCELGKRFIYIHSGEQYAKVAENKGESYFSLMKMTEGYADYALNSISHRVDLQMGANNLKEIKLNPVFFFGKFIVLEFKYILHEKSNKIAKRLCHVHFVKVDNDFGGWIYDMDSAIAKLFHDYGTKSELFYKGKFSYHNNKNEHKCFMKCAFFNTEELKYCKIANFMFAMRHPIEYFRAKIIHGK